MFSSIAASPSAEQALLKSIITEERKSHARPILNSSDVMEYSIGLEITQILDVSTEGQVMHVTGFLRQQWKNELMGWDPDNYSNITAVNVDMEHVWHPETVLYNGIGKVSSHDEASEEWTTHDIKTKINIKRDGINSWLSPLTLKSSCSFDVSNLPHDAQRCVITLGPWTDSSKIRCYSNNLSVITTDFKKNVEWKIVSASQTIVDTYYECCEKPFSLLQVELLLERKPLFYHFNFILPCTFLIATILISHWVPPQSGERIVLCITVGLACYFMLNLITSRVLPRTSEVSMIYKVYVLLISTVLFSTLATCLVLIMYHTPDLHHTWLPTVVEKRYLPKELWLSSLIADGIIEEDQKKSKNRGEDKMEGVMLIARNVKEKYGANFIFDPLPGKTFDKVRKAKKVGKQNILKEVQFLNDTAYEEERNKRVQNRSEYITRLVDRSIFWVLLVVSLTTVCLTTLPSYF